ncbi:MAG: lysophospholipid acyltransferase family protein [Gammaproteobacteria bacterium]
MNQGHGANLRALVYYTGAAIAAAVVCTLLLLTLPLPYRLRFRTGRLWTDFNLWMLRHVCGIRAEVRGREHIPAGPAIIMAKHQSAWETMALQQVFPPQVWLLKRELLWIPLFGWGLWLLKSIAIDRSAGFRAMKALVRQGRDRLGRGIWVVVFPEGTRVAPDATRKYQPGGGLLAVDTGCPVVPVAHNAGLYWPRNSFAKRPGTIRMEIGPPIDPKGLSATEVTERARDWIEASTRRLVEEARAADTTLAIGRNGTPVESGGS